MTRASRVKLRKFLEMKFRGLHGTKWRITSAPTARYNCLAWAIGENHRRIDFTQGHWPNHLRRGADLCDLIALYQSMGFVVCMDETCRTFDPEYDKIVVYAARFKEPGEPEIHEWMHAAKLLPNGHWSSKLGYEHDISHPDPESLAGREYGEPLIYMRRKASNPRGAKGKRKSK